MAQYIHITLDPEVFHGNFSLLERMEEKSVMIFFFIPVLPTSL